MISADQPPPTLDGQPSTVSIATTAAPKAGAVQLVDVKLSPCNCEQAAQLAVQASTAAPASWALTEPMRDLALLLLGLWLAKRW